MATFRKRALDEAAAHKSKDEVKAAVEAIFNVKVNKVNTIRTNGKQKVFRGHIGQRSDYKKAVVTLAEGQNIDVTTGI